MAACYRCAMVGKREPVPGNPEQRRRVEATTTREGKPVCEGHAAEYDGIDRSNQKERGPGGYVEINLKRPVW